MIKDFPSDHELLTFFEAEPTVLDPGIPWNYNTLDFTTIRNDIEVRARLVPSFGQLTTRLLVGSVELAKFELRDAEAFRLVIDKGHETLVATFAPELRLDNFALQLKPCIWAAWGNLHQFP